MAQDESEPRATTGKRRRANLPWPAARKSEVVKVSYETSREGKEATDGDDTVLVKPRATSREMDASTLSRVTPVVAPADPESADLKMYWIPDKACKECSECGIRFSFVVRRHHCRVCGRIYCSDCCSYTVPKRQVMPGQRGSVKACLRCVEVSKAHIVSKERSDSRNQHGTPSDPFLEVRRKAFDENAPEMSRVASFDSETRPAIEGTHDAATERAEGERLLTLYEDEVKFNIQKIWSSFSQEMFPRTHRLRFRTYPRSFSAQEVVEWLMKSHAKTREEALQIGQALVDFKHLNFINSTTGTFIDNPNVLLETGEPFVVDVESTKTSEITHDDPAWLHNINNPFDDPMLQPNAEDSAHEPGANFFESVGSNVAANQATVMGQSPTDSHISVDPTDPTTSEHIYDTIQSLNLPSTYDGTSRDKSLPSIQQVHDNHFDALLVQLVRSQGLSLSWIGVIKSLVIETCREVRTNLLQGDSMDIKKYVKVKKIPGGRKADSTFIYGVVCSKNVTHKKMCTTIENPTIMLLMCAFEFERDEGALSVLDTLQLQEQEYLKNVVAKIKKFHPSIIMVQKSVSRIALEMLFELGIVVVVNVKPVVMNKLARSTNATLLYSLDQLTFDVTLGTCGQFYVTHYTLPDGCKKTLMYFDQCDPAAGCVITLRGGHLRELKKVKRVAQFALHMAYNSFLESSFLADGFSLSPDVQLKSIEASTTGYHSIPNTPECSLYPINCMAELPSEPAANAVLDIDDQSTCPLKAYDQSGFNVSTTAPSHPGHIGEENPESNLTPSSGSQITPVQAFKSALQDAIITVSPNVCFSIPHLLTETPMGEDVKRYLSRNAYWSKVFKPAHVQKDEMAYEGNNCGMEGMSPLPISQPLMFQHNYKSMSDHPFTSSIFIGKASSNDMKAALADYRARAGNVGEDNAFFFLSAKRAAQYQRSINKMFRKYQHFERKAKQNKKTPEETHPVEMLHMEENLLEVGDTQQTDESMHEGRDLEKLEEDEGEDGRLVAAESEDRMGEEELEQGDESEWERNMEEVKQRQVIHTEESASDSMQKGDTECTNNEVTNKLEPEKYQSLHDVKPKVSHKQSTMDCMDPSFHQSIKVVYSTLCTVAKSTEDYCVKPHVICMQYYGKGDLTLGDFLQRFCFRYHYLCNVCSEDMLNHSHRIVHNLCAIDICIYSTTSKTRTVSTWFKCTICDKITALVEMNEKSLLLSFAKFLELKFYGSGYTASGFDSCQCQHSAMKDYAQYFCSNGLLAEFLPSTISILSTRLPSMHLGPTITSKEMYESFMLEIKSLQEKTTKLIGDVANYLKLYQHVPVVSEYTETLKGQRDHYLGQVKKLKERVKESCLRNDAVPETAPEGLLDIMDELNNVILKLKVELIAMEDDWNNRLEKIYNDNPKHFWEQKLSSEPGTHKDDSTLPTNDVTGAPSIPPAHMGSSDRPAAVQVEGAEDGINFADEFEGPVIEDSGDYDEIDDDTNRNQQENWLVLQNSTDGKQTESHNAKEKLKKSPRKIRKFLTRQFQPLQPLFHSNEHHLHVTALRIPLSVYENEPTSIIAFTLSSHLYTDAVSQATSTSQQQTEPSMHAEEDPTVPFDAHNKAEHISLEFNEQNARFYCKVYFAKDFEKLREKFIPSGEYRYIRQLFRSIGHRPKGGKTGAEFYRTVDNRYLIKEVQPVEMSSFEEIAPKYFQYVMSAVNKQNPLVLGKILGMYTVGYKNTKTGNSKRIDVVVMENLLYGCKYQKVFDLKGCTRNRCAEDTSSVLLDVNFLKYSTSKPVYLYPHSKHVLMQAISMDTQFLAENAVIDYSLLTCVDRTSGELVVGIIDFLRTFTLDKRLEMHVKKLSSKILPTVVYPELYRKRFFEALEKYFIAVPDKWTGLESDLVSP